MRRTLRSVLVSTPVLALAMSGTVGLPAAHAAGTDQHFFYHPFVMQQASVPMESSLISPGNNAACRARYHLDCNTPATIRQAYNVPSTLTGAGQSIVIVDAFGSPTLQSDLATFNRVFHLPSSQLNVYYPNGPISYNYSDANQSGWAGETTLDVEYAHAIAPGATINLVVAKDNQDNNISFAEFYAVSHHLGQVMSFSFGQGEKEIPGTWQNGPVVAQHSVLGLARQNGMSVFVSSGDWGANMNGQTDGSQIDASSPANEPNVTAVSGTNLFENTDHGYSNETVWNDSNSALCPYGCAYGPIGATGGAVTTYYGVPDYQAAVLGKRAAADVSYNASVYTAILTLQTAVDPSCAAKGLSSCPKFFYFIGGTSEGAPQWAGIAALANQAAGHPLGFLNNRLYAIANDPIKYANDFHDVTVGDNGFFGPGYTAGPGYDVATGLGSPNVANLVNDLASMG